MGTSYDKFLKKFNKGFQERKTNRVVKRTQPYGRGLGKSHKQYIAGDIVSSASNRAYGYKMNGITPINQFTGGQDPYLYKKQQEGENPYEFKYVYTGIPTWVKGGTSSNGKKYKGFWSKNRMATDEEKDLYKKTGDLDFEKADRKVNYSVMRGHNEKADNFKEHLNTPVWDGLEVANNRVKNGGSKFEYLKGFLKDIAVDPLFDTLKTFDKYESALTGSIGGVIEESRNVFDAFADKDISKIDFKRPIKNAQESFSESDKTGWGKSMGDFFSEAVDRRDERELARLKSLPQNAYTKLQIKNIKEKQENKANEIFEKAVGFAGDIASPVNLGTGVIKAGKKITGNTIDAFNDLRKGTTDLSMGIMPKHIREANQKKAMEVARREMENVAKKGSSEVLDALHETKPMNDLKLYDDYKLDGVLNQGYKNAMNNDIDKVIKSNPATQNLGKFLDDIKPQKSPVIDDFENLFEASDVPNSRLGKDLFFKKIDNLPDRESDEVLDWLAEYNPKVYNEYLDGVDDLDDFADKYFGKKVMSSSKEDEINEGTNKLLEIFGDAKPSETKIKELNESYNKINLERLAKDKPPTYKRKNLPTLKKDFSNMGRNFALKLKEMNTYDLEGLSKTLSNMGAVEDNVSVAKVIKELNNKIFGKDVIRSNIPKNRLKQIVNHLEDLVNYNLATQTGKFKIPVHDNDGNKVIHYLIDRNGKPNPYFEKFNFLSPSAVDELFETKMSDIDKFLGIKNKSVYKKPLEELEELLKNGKGLNSKQLEEYKKLKEQVEIWDSLYADAKNLDFDKYTQYSKDKYNKTDVVNDYLKNSKGNGKLTYDDIYNEVYNEFEKSGDLKKIIDEGTEPNEFISDIADVRYNEYLNEMNNYKVSKNINERTASRADGVDEFGKTKLHQSPRLEQENLNPVGNKTFDSSEQVKQLYDRLKISIPVINKGKIKLEKGQKLGHLPPVIENSKNLRKVIESEMEMMYKKPSEYVNYKDAFNQIKKSYVDSMRSFGVKDESYFNKVKAVQKDLELYYKELNKPTSIIKKSSEGGQGTPKLGMNLQLLAERINKGLDDLDIKDVKKSSKTDEFVNGFDKFNQKTNAKPIEESTKATDEFVDEQEIYNTINKIGKKYGGEDIKPPSYEDFKKMYKDENPHMKYEDSKIYDIYKRWLNTWKKGLTVYNPGWHIQNFFQNKGQNYLALGKDAFGSQKNAKNLLNYLQGGANKVEDVIDKKNGVVYSADDLKALVKRNKVVNSQTNDIMESRGMIPFLETKIDNSKLMKKLGHSEDTARLYHFITQLERGMSPEDASKSVNKYLFDYDKKSKFDKVMGDFVDPFWTFHKNYAELLGKTAIENPSAINKILRSERGLESGLAESERNNTSTNWDKLQSPYNSFKDEKNGKMYDYLYKQNIMPRIQDAIPTNQDEVENKLNPILRLLLQQSRNEGNFHNKIVDKDEAGWNEITKDDRAKEIAMELNPFLNSFAKAIKKSSGHQEEADKGKQSQSTSDKQILLDWIEFITGNKANYYKR